MFANKYDYKTLNSKFKKQCEKTFYSRENTNEQ